MSKVVGWEMRVKINGAFFGVKRYEAEDTVKDEEVSDSEDGQFEVHEDGLAVGKITIESATYDPVLNPVGAPFTLAAGNHVSIEAFRAGLTEDSDNFPDVLITSCKATGDHSGQSPMTFTGVTSGPYTMAGE